MMPIHGGRRSVPKAGAKRARLAESLAKEYRSGASITSLMLAGNCDYADLMKMLAEAGVNLDEGES